MKANVFCISYAVVFDYVPSSKKIDKFILYFAKNRYSFHAKIIVFNSFSTHYSYYTQSRGNLFARSFLWYNIAEKKDAIVLANIER